MIHFQQPPQVDNDYQQPPQVDNDHQQTPQVDNDPETIVPSEEDDNLNFNKNVGGGDAAQDAVKGREEIFEDDIDVDKNKNRDDLNFNKEGETRTA